MRGRSVLARGAHTSGSRTKRAAPKSATRPGSAQPRSPRATRLSPPRSRRSPARPVPPGPLRSPRPARAAARHSRGPPPAGRRRTRPEKRGRAAPGRAEARRTSRAAPQYRPPASPPRSRRGRPGPAPRSSRAAGRPATTRPRRPLPLRRGRGPPAPSREAGSEDTHHGEGCAGLLPSPFGRALRAAAAVNVFLRRRRLRLLAGPSAASRSCAVRRIPRARGRRCGKRPGRFGDAGTGRRAETARGEGAGGFRRRPRGGSRPGDGGKGSREPRGCGGPGFPRGAARSAPPFSQGEAPGLLNCRIEARRDVSPVSAPLLLVAVPRGSPHRVRFKCKKSWDRKRSPMRAAPSTSSRW